MDSEKHTTQNSDPRLQRLRDVADLVRVDVSAEQDPVAIEQLVKCQIDAVVSPLSVHRRKLIALMRNSQEPLDQEVVQWTTSQVQSSMDQVRDALTCVPRIQALDPNFIVREFTSRGFDLSQAEDTINTLNNDMKNVGGFGVRRDIRARTLFKAALTHIAFVLRAVHEGSMDQQSASVQLNEKAELIRNLLTKKLILKTDDPQQGWYE